MPMVRNVEPSTEVTEQETELTGIGRNKNEKSRKSRAVTRINVNFGDAAKEALDEVCDLTGRNTTEAIKGAIGTERHIQRYLSRGATVFVEIPGEPIRELIFT